MKVKKLFIVFIILSLIFASGCYDRIEIEQRAIISSILVDISDEYQESYNDLGKTVLSVNKSSEKTNGPLNIIFGIINPSKIQAGEKAFETIEVKAINIPDGVEKLGERISRNPFFAQMRLLILTDKVVKNEKVFKEVLDRLDRSTKINETAGVLLFKEDLKKLSEIDPKIESTVSGYLVGIMENSKIVTNTSSLTIYKFLSDIRNNEGRCCIPVLEIKSIEKGYEPYINKLCLIKDYKFLTYLDTEYVKEYRIMNNDFESGRVLVDYNDMTIPFFIYSINKRIWLLDDKENLKYKVKIEIEGDVDEYKFGKDLFDSKIIDDINKKIGEDQEKRLTAITKYFQNVIGVDYLGFKDYTHKYHNKVFKKYEDNWDEAFKNADIDYEVKVYIRRIGVSKK